MTVSSGRRVKVLQVTGITVGGSAEHLLQLSTALPRDRFDVRIALSGGGPLDPEILTCGLPVLDYAPSHGEGQFTQASPDGPRALLRQFLLLRRHMQDEGYDIVHTHTSVAGAMGRVAAWSCGVPVRVHMVHAYASHDGVRQPLRTAYRLVERLLDRITTHYVTGSAYIRDVGVRRGILRAADVSVIHYASRMQPRDTEPAQREAVRRSLALPQDAVIAALVGRIEEQKGVDHLLTVVPRVLERVPLAHVVVVGDGSLRPAMEKLAETLGVAQHVSFVGWRNDLADVLGAVDLLAIPSRWEAFGIVNLEAMAAAKPVVGFAVEGIPEVVVHGETGLLCPPGDRGCLAESLVRVMSHPALAARLGAAGRRRLEQSFSPALLAEAHVALYERLLAAASSRGRAVSLRRRTRRAGG